MNCETCKWDGHDNEGRRICWKLGLLDMKECPVWEPKEIPEKSDLDIVA